MKRVTILGSTGSIGQSTLQVLAQHSQKFQVYALSAHSNVKKMVQQCRAFLPQIVVMVDENAAQQLHKQLRENADTASIKVLSGADNVVQIARSAQTDYVMAAIVGAAGLPGALAAARSGKRVMLANKEALVMAGKLFMRAIQQSGAELLPVDSEHNAIFQSLPENFSVHQDNASYGIEKIILTASGGPFLYHTQDQLKNVTAAQACAHPNWSMGKKISVDSATMMNKGLEIIEASWLFGMRAQDIEVVIHPQSIIHSLVSYCDGSVLAQLGHPDMCTPIAFALSWPERIEIPVKRLNLAQIATLEFLPPDLSRFPCLRLSYDALKQGGGATVVLNAANEVAVEAFLQQKIPFMAIAQLVEYVLLKTPDRAIEYLHDIDELDQMARITSQQWLSDQYRLGLS